MAYAALFNKAFEALNLLLIILKKSFKKNKIFKSFF